MSVSQKWADLRPRILSAIVLAGAGLVALWAGGAIFAIFVSAFAGIMVWEALRMFGGLTPVRMGVLAGFAVFLAAFLPAVVVLPILLACVIVSCGQKAAEEPVLAALVFAVLLGSYGMILFRNEAGVIWLLCLILIVIATDMAGYFAGKSFGGPKFWPKVSPKKTWSGIVAGWGASAVVGAIFALSTGAGYGLVLAAILMSFCSQMGDIAESAAKRKCGIKDSSDIIPGHGGAMDRFDGMMGAALVALVLWTFGLLPAGGL